MTLEQSRVVTIGADPELFLMDGKGSFISSIGKIGGSKIRPRPIGKDCAVQEDNVAVEFCIPPAKDADAFIESCNYALSYLAKHAADKELFLNMSASAVFPKEQLTHMRALVFGCDPDFNAWTGDKNPSPKAENKNLRSAGGHIHIGGVEDLNPLQMARHCDIFIGLPSVLEDQDTDRRKLYGKAGAFRRKPYGIEYRTPSNYWLRDEATMKKVFYRARHAAEMCGYGWVIDDDEGEGIQFAINNSDRKLAETLMTTYGAD